MKPCAATTTKKVRRRRVEGCSRERQGGAARARGEVVANGGHLQRGLQLVDVGIELEVVPIKLIHVEVEELVGFALEVGDDAEKVAHEAVHALEVVLGEHGELLHRREHVDELLHAPAVQVELAEDDR